MKACLNSDFKYGNKLRKHGLSIHQIRRAFCKTCQTCFAVLWQPSVHDDATSHRVTLHNEPFTFVLYFWHFMLHYIFGSLAGFFGHTTHLGQTKHICNPASAGSGCRRFPYMASSWSLSRVMRWQRGRGKGDWSVH